MTSSGLTSEYHQDRKADLEDSDDDFTIIGPKSKSTIEYSGNYFLKKVSITRSEQIGLI